LEDLDGNPVQLLDYVEAGKPTLIEIWASWCENCEALQPQLDQIHQEFGGQVNVVAVAVAVSQSQRRVRRHVEEHDPGYPYLWDGKGEVVRAYSAATTSIVILLDEGGTVAYTGVGGGQDLVGEVGRLVGG
jgi:thiol-disulfide isomerase/thioredoxin